MAAKVLGGWVLTGIHQYSVGTPIILTANNTLPLGNQVLRPDAIGGVTRATNVSNFDPARDLWINRDAFKAPAAFTFGSSARSYTDLRAPNFYNENFGLIKRVKFCERLTATFRGELFKRFQSDGLRRSAGATSATRSSAASRLSRIRPVRGRWLSAWSFRRV